MYQSNIETRSLLQEIEFLKSKCYELENENKILLEEQHIISKKAHDIITQDNTIENYVRDNQTLHLEVEKAQKLARQRKTDADLWKSKYENQMQQILQIKQNYEYEIRNLNAEIQKLQHLLSQSDYQNQKHIIGIQGQLESQNNVEIENLKKASSLQIEIAESQIRKLKDHIDDQNNHINELQSKLLRQKGEDDSAIERLLKENELLRIKSIQQDAEKQRELELLNDNLNSFTDQQLQVLKLEFARQADVMQSEIDKLKGLLEIKNTEIETLMLQNQKNKNLYEDQISDLRAEIQDLKNKIIDIDRQHRQQLEFQQKDLLKAHQRDVDALKSFYNEQLANLERDNNNLKGIIDHKNEQIQIQIDEKNQLRAQLDQQVLDLRRDLENQKIQTYEIERQKNAEIVELDDQFQKAQALANDTMDQQKMQIIFLEGEIEKLKDLIVQKTKELDSYIAQFSLAKRTYEDDIRRLKDEIHLIKQESMQQLSSKNTEIQDLSSKIEKTTTMYRDKIRQADIQSEQQIIEIKRLRESINVRDQEIDNLSNQRSILDKDLKRAREEVELFKNRILLIEKEKCQQLEDLKIKLEQSNQYQISNLKTAYNTQVSVLNQENQQLKQQLENRRIYDIRS
ncbi:hypothetical protein pb186bvf_007530 [Paramecium bursaria]